MAARPGAGPGAASRSGPFLPPPSSPHSQRTSTTHLSFFLLQRVGERRETGCLQGLGQTPTGGRRDFRAPPEVTRQSRSPPGGTAGGFRCQPGPGPAVGPTLSVSDRSGSQGSGDPGADSGIRAHRPGLGSSPVPSKSHLPRLPALGSPPGPERRAGGPRCPGWGRVGGSWG